MNDRTKATAKIEVQKYEPVPYDEPSTGPNLVRIHVEETFSGEIAGHGVVEFLQVADADGSASFVGLERVSGSVGGRSGSFVLQDQGSVAGGTVSGTWFVVPGSGTDGLAGLRGEGGFSAALGSGADVWLDYWFD